ncbi:MAG: type II toxin-antitoxin system Phd/YefM family antitoxin [Pseudorhodoplanes sp.]
MARVSYTDLRSNLAKYMDEVCDNRDALTVTRQNARSVVMLSEDEYESILETLHLLRSPANAAHLARGLKEFEAGAVIERDIVTSTKASGSK